MKIRKILYAMAFAALATATFPLAAQAETIGKTSGSHTFSADWEVKENLTLHGQKVGECVYGFDKRPVLSDQDYAECYFVDHQAKTIVAPGGHTEAESGWSYPSTWTEKVTCKHQDKYSSVSYYFQSNGNI